MSSYIDIYCERLVPGLWAEPLNLVTNMAFIFAAIAAFVLTKRLGAFDYRSSILVGLIACIGTGSAAFHSFATFPAMMMDVLPILLFQICFIAFYALGVIRMRGTFVLGLLAMFFVTMAASMQLPREWLNGSLEYLPALLFLLGLAVWHWRYAAASRCGLFMAALVFVCSLTFRSIDMALCDAWVYGTHFMWHCLNSVVLYLSYRGYVLNVKKA